MTDKCNGHLILNLDASVRYAKGRRYKRGYVHEQPSIRIGNCHNTCNSCSIYLTEAHDLKHDDFVFQSLSTCV